MIYSFTVLKNLFAYVLDFVTATTVKQFMFADYLLEIYNDYNITSLLYFQRSLNQDFLASQGDQNLDSDNEQILEPSRKRQKVVSANLLCHLQHLNMCFCVLFL